MIKPNDHEYWSTRFDVTCEDLHQVREQLERIGRPQDLKAIVLPIIRRRIESGQESSLPMSHKPPSAASIHIWNPAGARQAGDIVLVAHDRFGNSHYEPFLGEVVFIDPEAAAIKIDELEITKTFARSLPGAKGTRNEADIREAGGDFIADIAEKKLGSAAVDEQAEGVLLRYGENILARLESALRRDDRFASLEGKWYPADQLPHVDNETLQTVHRFLLQNPPLRLEGILPVINEDLARDPSLLKMAIHIALQKSPDRFDNIGTSAQPLWKARLPSYDKAAVIQFAFDPQTFELLCRPGQQLNKKKAHRLQELNLYAHVVTFPEWLQMTHP